MTKQIPLTNDKRFVLIDDEDYERVMTREWFYDSSNGRVRACDDKDPRFIYQFILGEKGIDHVNGDTLDNTRKNLRVCNQSQNMANSGIPVNNTSGYKGVSKSRERWGAYIHVNYKRIHLGVFDSKEDAARAYDKAALEHFGEFAKLNFS